MTTPYDDHLDELASARLDGETEPDGDGRQVDDDAVRTRMDELAAVRAALARTSDPTPVDGAVRDRAIAAALAAFEEPVDTGLDGGTDGSDPAVLGERRATGAGADRRRRLLAVAAVVAVAAVAVPVLARLTDDDTPSDLSSVALDDADEAAGEDTAGAVESDVMMEAAPGMGDGGAFTAGSVDLGAFPDAGALAESLRTDGPDSTVGAESPDAGTAGSTTTMTTPCAAEAQAHRQAAGHVDAPVILSATAVVDGARVIVAVYELSTGERRMQLLDPDSCAVVSDVTL